MSSAILSPHTTSLTSPVAEPTPSSSSRPRRAAAYRKTTNEQVSPAPTTASLSTNPSARSASRVSRSGSATRSFQSPEKKSTTIVIRPKRSGSGSGSTSTSDHSAQGGRNSLHSSPGSASGPSGPSGSRRPRRGRADMRRSDEDEGEKEVEIEVLGLDLGFRGDGNAEMQNGDVEMQGEEGESEIDPLDVIPQATDRPDVAAAEGEDEEVDEEEDEEEGDDEDDDDDEEDDDDDEYFVKQPGVISPTKAREKTEEVRRITLRFGTKPKVEPTSATEPAETPAPEPEHEATPEPEPEPEPAPALGLEPIEQHDEADEIVKEEVDADADADNRGTAELSEPPEEIMEVDEEPGDVFSGPPQPSSEVKSAIAENKYVPEAPKRAPRKKRKWLKKGEVDPDDPIAVARQKERHQMIDEAIADLDRQTEMIIDGTHPQLVAMLAELERRQALQLRWADRRHEAEFEDLIHMRNHAKEQAMFNWRVRRDALADEITQENAHKMSQLSMERNISRREPNTAPWLRDGQGGGGWTVYDERILSKGTQKLVPVLVNGKLRQRKDLSHNVSMLQSDEIDSDLIKLGLRKAPAPPMQIKRSRSESPPPIPVRAKASRTGESSRRTTTTHGTHASVVPAPAPPAAAPATARSHESSSTPASRPPPRIQSLASLLPLSTSSMSVSLAHPTPPPASASTSASASAAASTARAPAVPQSQVKKIESPDPLSTPSHSQVHQDVKPLNRPWYAGRYGIAEPYSLTSLSAKNAPKPSAGVDRASASASVGAGASANANASGSGAGTSLTNSKLSPTTRPVSSAPSASSTTNGFGSSSLKPAPAAAASASAAASQPKPDPYRRDDWRRSPASSAYNSPGSFGLFGGMRSSYGSPITANRLPSSSTPGSSAASAPSGQSRYGDLLPSASGSAASRYGSTSLGGNRPLTSSFASPSVSPSSTPAGLSGGAGAKTGTASSTTASVTGSGAGATTTNGNTTGTGTGTGTGTSTGAGNGNGTGTGTGNGGSGPASSANLLNGRRGLPGGMWHNTSRLFY